MYASSVLNFNLNLRSGMLILIHRGYLPSDHLNINTVFYRFSCVNNQINIAQVIFNVKGVELREEFFISFDKLLLNFCKNELAIFLFHFDLNDRCWFFSAVGYLVLR